MAEIRRTDSDDKDFRDLFVLPDQDLRARDGEEHAFYAQYNKLDKIRHAAVYHMNGEPAFRGKGIAAGILKEQALSKTGIRNDPQLGAV